MRLRPKDLTCTSTSPGASIGLGTSSIKRASAGPCWPRMSAPVLVIKDMPGSGQSNLLIAFIMLSPKIEYQSQEESVVTIQIEDTLVSCSAIGTDGADSLLTRDPVSAVSYVLLMYCKTYPLHVFGYTTDGLLHQCNLLMCNWRWHVAIPLYPTDNADSASGFQKGRTLATRRSNTTPQCCYNTLT